MAGGATRLFRENVDEAGILAALKPLLAAFAEDRKPGEGFGDFTVRTGVVAAPAAVERSVPAAAGA